MPRSVSYAVEQLRDQFVRAGELNEEAAHLIRRKHHRQAFRAIRAHGRDRVGQVDAQDVTIQE